MAEVWKKDFPHVNRKYPNDRAIRSGFYEIYDPKEWKSIPDDTRRVLRHIERAHTNYWSLPEELREKNKVVDDAFWTVVGWGDKIILPIFYKNAKVKTSDRWYEFDDETRFLNFYVSGVGHFHLIDRRVKLYGAYYTARAIQKSDKPLFPEDSLPK